MGVLSGNVVHTKARSECRSKTPLTPVTTHSSRLSPPSYGRYSLPRDEGPTLEIHRDIVATKCIHHLHKVELHAECQ